MPHLRIHVSPSLKLAAQDAAERSGLSLSEWARLALDMASVGEIPARELRQAENVSMTGEWVLRGGYIGIRVSEIALIRYREAAALAWLGLSPWCAVMLAVAAGISDLPKQIRRLS